MLTANKERPKGLAASKEPNQIILVQVPKVQPVALITSPEDSQHYEEARQCVEELALYLKPLSNTRGTKTQSFSPEQLC